MNFTYFPPAHRNLCGAPTGNPHNGLFFLLSIPIIVPTWPSCLLEARLLHQIQRNGLVLVFLRKLKCSQSILFLTMNWMSNFDDAIINRINLMLRFEALSKDSEIQIWKNFLTRASAKYGPAKVNNKNLISWLPKAHKSLIVHFCRPIKAIARYNQNSSVPLAANPALLLFRSNLYHFNKLTP